MTSAGVTCVPWIGEAETLYSYCVFVHRFNRMPSSAGSARMMLNAVHATRQHDLPSALCVLTKFAEPIFSEPVQALLRHTVASFYWPFMTEVRRQAATSSILAPGNCFGMRVIGASTRRLAIDHPLKWCPECFAEDLRAMGRPCWHTKHQYPTSFVCSEHGVPLLAAGGGGKTWKWPNEENNMFRVEGSAITSTLSAVGQAAASHQILSMDALRASTIDRLADLGVLHSRRTVRHERLQRWFSDTPVGRWLPTAPNGLATLKSGDWIAKMIWRRPTAHAVRWVVLWSALDWDSPEEAATRFLAAGYRPSCVTATSTATACSAWPRPSAPPAFEAAVNACYSYDAIAQRLGATRSDVVRWFEAYPLLRREWRQRWLARRKRSAHIQA